MTDSLKQSEIRAGLGRLRLGFSAPGCAAGLSERGYSCGDPHWSKVNDECIFMALVAMIGPW